MGVELRLHRSTYNPRPSGLKAFYLLLQKQGFKVARWNKNLEELPPDSRLLMVVDPEIPVSAKELEALDQWISRGNTAAFFLDRGETLKNRDLLTRYQRLAREEVTPRASSPLIFDLKALKDKGDYRLQSSREDLLVLARDQTGPLAALIPLGKGRLVVVSSPWMISNAGVGEEENYIFAANIARFYGGSTPVLFDEYHHGYGSERSLWAYLSRRPLFWSLVQLMVLAVLFIYVRNVRLGRAKTLHYEERRSALEYVESMANIYALARADALVLETLYRDFLRDAGKILGCPPSVEPSQLAELLERWGAGERKTIENKLKRIETVISQAGGERKEIYNLGLTLEQWRRKIRGF